ncbi:MAG TPA: hypothetical protein VMU63_03260 [Acidimicrobiales bacterium]|nr:hypothetical protein [Acidimicrobiales bacterium]
MSGPGWEDGQDDLSEDGDDEYPRRFPRWAVILLVIVVLGGGGLGLGLGLAGKSTPAPSGPEGVPVQNVPDLAPASTTASGSPVDGITCRPTMDQGASFHIHDHVDIFVNGQQRRLPAGAGIAAPRLAEHLTTGLFVDNSPSGCLYWLHVHSDDGIIHIEAPHRGSFTLGQFFDIWGQPLSSDQVGPARGTVVAFVNGKVFHGDPRNIPLLVHGTIQLDVGTPVVPFQPIQFNVSGLCGAGTSNCSVTGS